MPHSRETLKRWILEGRVTVGGETAEPRQPVGSGDVIEVEEAPPLASSAEPDSSVTFGVIFEDDHLIVVDKPAGLAVHPAGTLKESTLVNGLLARPGFRRAPSDPLDPEGALRPGIVHRLDKDTSGVLVVAKDAPTREGLKLQFADHSIDRQYRAITVGVPPLGTIRSLHGRHPTSRVRFTSKTDRGREAITHVEDSEPLAEGRAALVRCRLATGRTHQIRVHLAEQADAALLADRVYGKLPADPDLRAIAEGLGRQALHAGRLGFRHPVGNAPLGFDSPLPPDMEAALAALRALPRARRRS